MNNRISLWGRCAPWALLALALPLPAAADSVVLHPGTLTATVAIQGETVNNGHIYATSTDGFSGSLSFPGSTGSLILEGGHAYRRQLNAYLTNDGGTATIQITRNTATLIEPDASVAESFSYAAAHIAGTITVSGATVSSYQITASAAEGTEQYSSTRNRSGSSSFSLPMILDSSVQVSGNVTATLASGQTVTLSLPSQTINLGPGGAALQWDLVAPTLGDIQGTLDIDGPDIVNYHYAYAYSGPTSKSANNIPANSGYSLTGLPAGTYNTYAATYFNAPYGYLRHPWQSVVVPAGGVGVRDYTTSLALAHGTVELQGFYTNATINTARVSTSGSGGWNANDAASLPDGQYDLALAPGAWTSRTYSFNEYNTAPSAYTNASFQVTDPTPGWTLAAGDDVTLADRTILTVETQIIFDVAEPAGAAEMPISQPIVDGNAPNLYFYAAGPNTASPRPVVRVIAVPGTYNAQAFGYVSGSYVKFASFSFTIPEPAPTPIGTDVEVPASEDVTVTFENVVTPGVTVSTSTPVGPQPPEGYVPAGITPRYDDITTTATFNGLIEVCFGYDESGLEDEDQLQILQYEDGAWTSLPITSRDLVNNELCGLTDDLSQFTIMIFLDEDGDGVLDTGDNCPAVANADQSDADADGIGDACDNCPVDANAAQGDADGNGIGNACDPVCLTVQRGAAGSVSDTFLAAGEPDYAAGDYPYLFTGQHSSGEKMSAIAFELGELPGDATIQGASLTLSMEYASSAGAIDAHAITAPWDEATAMYESLGGSYDPTVLATVAVQPGSAGPQTWDITGLAQAWASGELPNHGLLIRESGSNKHGFRSSEHASASLRPRLDLCYVTP